MSLRYALLGLLAEEPASGYELTKKFERALQRYAWHAKHSQIYPELTKLADAGLVEVVEEGARGRRTYAVTDEGRADLRHWLVNPPTAYDVRNELVLRLFFVSTLDNDEARGLLRTLADESARELAALQEAVDKSDAHNTELVPGRLAAEYGLRSYQTIHDWALWALDRLDRSSRRRPR